MTQRERQMVVVVACLGGFLLMVFALLAFQGVLDYWQQLDGQIVALRRQVTARQTELKRLLQAQRELNHWRAISLPPDRTVASGQYRAFLVDLTRQHGLHLPNPIADSGLRTTAARTGTTLTPLTFQLTVEGTLARLIGFLEDFYSFNLPHLIRELRITTRGTSTDARLEAFLRIEVLSLPDAVNRDWLVAVPDQRLVAVEVLTALRHGPIGLAIAPWLVSPNGLYGESRLAQRFLPQRDYDQLAAKNVFAGLTPPPSEQPAESTAGDPQTLRFVQLTSITENFITVEAFLRNRLTNRFIRLRREGGFNTFTVRDSEGREVLKGRVVRIGRRSLVFQANDKYYDLHIGQFLSQALEQPLNAERLRALGLADATAAGNP